MFAFLGLCFCVHVIRCIPRFLLYDVYQSILNIIVVSLKIIYLHILVSCSRNTGYTG